MYARPSTDCAVAATVCMTSVKSGRLSSADPSTTSVGPAGVGVGVGAAQVGDGVDTGSTAVGAQPAIVAARTPAIRAATVDPRRRCATRRVGCPVDDAEEAGDTGTERV
ncbi:hypothetical protein MSA03_00190 [Microbacterium saccharophilum]|nr:hypothetical protein MSA03_00190 [Microbacterium saccharophilum]